MKSLENLISVVMPVYNRGRFLEEAIESVLQQEYSNFELVIINDGSSIAEIKKILRKYEQHPCVAVVHKQKNEGQASAMNAGAQKVRSKYFCRLDSDDKLSPDALAVLNRYIYQHPEVSYFYSSRYVIDGNSKVVVTKGADPEGIHQSRKFDRQFLLEKYHCNHLICWRTADYLQAGGLREDIQWAEDWELAVRMSGKYLFQNIDEALYFYRESHANRLTNTISDAKKEKFERMFL